MLFAADTAGTIASAIESAIAIGTFITGIANPVSAPNISSAALVMNPAAFCKRSITNIVSPRFIIGCIDTPIVIGIAIIASVLIILAADSFSV